MHQLIPNKTVSKNKTILDQIRSPIFFLPNSTLENNLHQKLIQKLSSFFTHIQSIPAFLNKMRLLRMLQYNTKFHFMFTTKSRARANTLYLFEKLVYRGPRIQIK